MKSLCYAMLCLAILTITTPVSSGDVDLSLHKALKGSGVIEKVEVRTGKGAVFEGYEYDRLVVLTVNRNYTTIQGEQLTVFHKRISETLLTHLEAKQGLILFQKSDGHVVDKVPFSTR